MKKSILLSGLLLICFIAEAQYSRHIIRLTDKKGTAYSMSDPTGFLSPKAINRRNKYKINIDSTDLPVSAAYLDSIKKAGTVVILSSSRWLNQVLIRTTDANALLKISSFPFVKKTEPIAERATTPLQAEDKFADEKVASIQQPATVNQNNGDLISYGSSYGQIHIHEGEFLHNSGFQGQGITLAVLDAGFKNYLTITAFDSLRKYNQILGQYDFVNNETSVNEDNSHGLFCFSIMAANLPGQFVGSAPKASYYLFRTEDEFSEFPVEEHNWVVAAERADSLGADMISSSLGYSLFDDPAFNHTYADMNGNTTMVSRGADLAARKGMIVCNSAGNSGNDGWKYIIAPADGDSVLAVGAVDVKGAVAGFSSYGPSSDGQIKPDVASVGAGTFVIATNGAVAQGDGTSFSNPNLAGLIACLWQAFPEFSNMQIIDAVRRSSSKFANPDDRVGYGIPNMKLAYQILLEKKYEGVLQDDWVKAFPNPFRSDLNVIVKAKESGNIYYQLLDMSGRLIRKGSLISERDRVNSIQLPGLEQLPKGAYNLRIMNGNWDQTIRLVK
ncbi:MAG TPA: S8 family serine peptidase [Chitinophagaceae bacterium]|nr:S8 family serine peptidase [Chitinophagaceae bacterium]